MKQRQRLRLGFDTVSGALQRCDDSAVAADDLDGVVQVFEPNEQVRS